MPVEAPLHIGLLGFGRMGSHHAERISLRDDCRLVSVADITPARRELAARSLGCAVHAAAEGILTDPAVEVVFVCTPTADHASSALAALHHGKHVVVEKPLCLAVADADRLIAAAREAGRMLTVVQNRRWDDYFRTALAAVRSGRLGKLQSLKFVAWRFSSLMRTYGAPEFHPEWRTERRLGGGLLADFAAHYFDQLLLLVDAPPVDVYANLTARRWSREVEDGYLVVVRFADGAIAQLESDLSSLAPFSARWTIAGSEGGYAEGTLYCEEEGEVVEHALERLPTNWDLYYANLHAHLREGAPLEVTPQQARRVVALIEAAQRSHETRQVVRLDPPTFA